MVFVGAEKLEQLLGVYGFVCCSASFLPTADFQWQHLNRLKGKEWHII